MSLELHHDFTFNPDGSGRVTVRWAGPNGAGAPRAEDFARSEIERATGVDTWADVRCEPEGEQLVFTGTAWFPDLKGLRFHCQGFHVSLLDFALTAHDDGSVELASAPSGGGRGDNPTLAANAGPAEVAEALKQERAKLEMARGFLDGMFGGLRCSALLRLPGPLAGDVRGERVADNAVQVRFDGAQLVAVFDRLMTDDALMIRLLRSGGLQGPEAVMELLGDNGPVALRTEPGATMQFDYASEVAAAREQFVMLADSLRAAVPQPEPATPLDNVRIVAAKVVREADSDRDLCPQGQNHPGVTLTIAADLPAPALELEDAAFHRCVLADGTDITPGEEWDRRCHFPKVTKDGTTVYLDFDLKAPADADGLGEFAGQITVVSSEGSELHDLGFPELAAGASGTFADAKLNSIEQEGEQQWRLEVQVQVARARILALALVHGDTSTVLEQTGYSCCNDDSTLTYRIDGDVPADARLEMTVVSDLSRTRFGFGLQQVDWFGHPIATRPC